MPSIFDGMKAGITEKAMEAFIRSKEAIDAQHIKGKIGDLETLKAKAIAELGQDAHAMLVANAMDQASLAAKSSAIADIETQISDKERELAEMHSAAEKQVADLKTADS